MMSGTYAGTTDRKVRAGGGGAFPMDDIQGSGPACSVPADCGSAFVHCRRRADAITDMQHSHLQQPRSGV